MKDTGRLGFIGEALAALCVSAVPASAPAPEPGRPQRIVFTSLSSGGTKLGIVLMNADGTGRTPLTKGDAVELDPALSPDGKRIAFVVASALINNKDDSVKGEVWVSAVDGSARKKLTVAKEKTLPTGPAWSPDGKRIAYAEHKEVEGKPEGDYTVVVMDADGKNARRLGKGVMPAFSPDGKKILYTDFSGDEARLVVMGADGKGVKPLPVDNAMQGVWSPDGKRIAYLGPNKMQTLTKLHVCNADGSGARRVTKKGDQFEHGQRWSSDGKRLYFSRAPSPRQGLPGKGSIFVIDADGKNEKKLTDGNAVDLLGCASLILMTFPPPE